MAKKNIALVTGSAGFIGYSVIKKLINENYLIFGLDNLNDFYDITLKRERLKKLGINKPNKRFFEKSSIYKNLFFKKIDINNYEEIDEIFYEKNISHVIHLAAQAGVRYSIENPQSYITNNIVGFWNMIDISRKNNVNHFIYASSSSIYGDSKDIPYNVHQKTDSPLSLYAATKKSNELIAHSYSKIYGLKTTGLRFFTVYGPWGRPDMAYFSFTKHILEGRKINVFNNGNLKRDFTYIDDIVDGVLKVLNRENKNLNEVYNLGNNKPIALLDFIQTLEKTLNLKAKINYLPHQKGDVYETYADIDSMIQEFNYNPKTEIQEGLRSFVKWYKNYYQIK